MLISVLYVENTSAFFCSPLYKRILKCQNALHRIILMSSFVSFLLYKSLISMLNIEHPDKFDEVIYYKYRLLFFFL